MRGFSLIELMVTIAVAAILLGIAAPSFQDLVIRNRLATNANQLVTALNLARSEAIKRGFPVTVCKSANPAALSSACSDSADVDWAQGWIVFVDNTPVAGNVAGKIDGDDQRLRVFEPGSGGALSISGGTNFAHWITYLPSGVSVGNNSLANGTLTLCISPKGRKVIVSPTGRARVEETTC